MAKTILTLCDPCLEDGTEARAETWQLSIRRPGARKAVERELDLCPDHAKPYAELVDYLGDNARTASSPPVPARKAPAPKVEPATELSCPLCQHVANTPGGLASHVRDNHGVGLGEARAQATGETLDYPCPDCERAFNRSQSLGVHRARKHGYVAEQPGAR
jgi:uncharacterized C2H2 Zn-finger protein